MRKALTYSSLVATGVLVVLAFVTAKTYTQLGVAVILYPMLAYFVHKLFIIKDLKAPLLTVQLPPAKKVEQDAAKAKKGEAVVLDIDRRAFLKLIGATGLSFFLFSLLGRRVESLFLDRAPLFGTPPPDGISPEQASPTAGYKIAEIADGEVAYYGFTNNSGAWLIMREETETGSFRYAKGDSNFLAKWANREQLNYDYFHNLSF